MCFEAHWCDMMKKKFTFYRLMKRCNVGIKEKGGQSPPRGNQAKNCWSTLRSNCG